MKRLIFICTGNICRSAMAKYYAQQKANHKSDNMYYITSAGISAIEGEGASANSKVAMDKYGIDMSSHRATPIDRSDIKEADYIFVMTKIHKRIVGEMYPELKEKIFTLKEFAYEDYNNMDIDDPWGYNIEVFTEIAKEIVDCVDKIFEKI